MAIIGMKDSKIEIRGVIESIDIWMLVPFCPDHDNENYQRLREQVVELGFVNPIIVRECDDGMYEIIDGHLRVMVACACGIHQIPAFVRKRNRK